MGWELDTTVKVGTTATDCRVQLEGGELVCRGALKRKIPHATMKQLSVRSGWLEFDAGKERIAVKLGVRAGEWLNAIRNPRTRIQKLGIVEGMKVCVFGTAEADSVVEIEKALGTSPSRRASKGVDVALLFAEQPEQLGKLAELEPLLANKGAVWALWPKGRKNFAHEDVVAAAKAAGLIQTRSIGFSPRFSGLRLVRPVSNRGGRAK